MKYCALSNPISKLLDKPKEEFTRDDLIHIFQEKQLERITFHYTGLDSKLKELKIPVANIKQAERILTYGERVDGSSLFKGMVDVSGSDLYVIPVYKTAFLNPFDDGSLDFICRFFNKDGERAPFTLDNILHNAYESFKKNTGMELYTMGELEFYLITEASTSMYQGEKQRGYHSSAPFVKTGQIINEMLRRITQMSGDVKYAHSEVGFISSIHSEYSEIAGKNAEQMEVEFLPMPIDEAADNLVLARWLIRNIAFQHGCVVTFAPKIEEGAAGNGYHVHMELRKNGENIMTDNDGALSTEAKKLIGGLCVFADTLTAFGNTSAAAYLRLVPNQEAPTRICWSDMNRSAMIRVPLGWKTEKDMIKEINPQQNNKNSGRPKIQTVELRTPDGSGITHLMMAGIAIAAEYGLTKEGMIEIAEKNYVSINIFADKKLFNSLKPLPGSCVASANLLKKNRALYEKGSVFPPEAIDYIISMLEQEDDLNTNASLAKLRGDDRLNELRKIMHKDLHRH